MVLVGTIPTFEPVNAGIYLTTVIDLITRMVVGSISFKIRTVTKPRRFTIAR
jgi:hypothetical protein